MAKFLLILLLVSFIIRFVAPVILRLLVGSFVQKQARRFEQQQGSSPFGPPPRPSSAPGEVRVEYAPPKQNPQQSKEFRGGEYVDFEEVK